MICTRCNLDKPAPAFPVQNNISAVRGTRHGRRNVCRICHNAGRIIVSMLCDAETLAAIDALALRNNTSRARAMSDLIRQALDAYTPPSPGIAPGLTGDTT